MSTLLYNESRSCVAFIIAVIAPPTNLLRASQYHVPQNAVAEYHVCAQSTYLTPAIATTLCHGMLSGTYDQHCTMIIKVGSMVASWLPLTYTLEADSWFVCSMTTR